MTTNVVDQDYKLIFKTVGLFLLQYSVVYTVESLSLFYLLFISRFVSHRSVRDLPCEPNIFLS